MRGAVSGFAEGAVSYQPEAGSMHVLRILLLVMTAGVLAFILTGKYQETLSGL